MEKLHEGLVAGIVDTVLEEDMVKPDVVWFQRTNLQSWRNIDASHISTRDIPRWLASEETAGHASCLVQNSILAEKAYPVVRCCLVYTIWMFQMLQMCSMIVPRKSVDKDFYGKELKENYWKRRLWPKQENATLVKDLMQMSWKPGELVLDAIDGMPYTANECLTLLRHRIFAECVKNNACGLNFDGMGCGRLSLSDAEAKVWFKRCGGTDGAMQQYLITVGSRSWNHLLVRWMRNGPRSL